VPKGLKKVRARPFSRDDGRLPGPGAAIVGPGAELLVFLLSLDGIPFVA